VTGALTWARLSFRQQKWELLLVLLGVTAAAAGMVWFAGALDAMRAANADCLAGVGGGFVGVQGEGPSVACQAIAVEYYEAESFASQLINLAWAAPFFMGVILGAPVVAREIDGGTAQLAWSLSRSRVTWLLRRIAFVAIFAVALLAVIAFTSELLASAILPDRTLDEDFTWFGRRGPLIVARGLGALGVGLLVGAIIGRVLPAVLASALVIALVFAGVSLGQDQWNRAEATLLRRDFSGTEMAETELTGLGVAFGIETTDGRFITHSEAFDSGLAGNYYGDEEGRIYGSEADMAAGRSIGYEAFLVIPGERYLSIMLRDSVIALVLGAVALMGAAVVVQRRRPG
jgi:hypothetical protein